MKCKTSNRKVNENQGNITLNDKAWEKLFDKYDIVRSVERDGMCQITANQIKEFREPRLMTKFDTQESLPRSFGKGKEKKMSILPVSRGSYVIGYFDTYKEFPEMEPLIKHVDFPDYLKTLSRENINSEANVINVMGVTNILENFMDEPQFVQTISGRMKSGIYDFDIKDLKSRELRNISVKNAQIEIDAGFENQNCVILMEAKNVVHKDFIVRQLYYPYRLWKQRVHKSIRPVFMVYSNNIFRLLEYQFQDTGVYSSLVLVKQKNYSFEDVDIKQGDIFEVYQRTNIEKEPRDVPFIQADSFHIVISLLELVREEPRTISELSDIIGFAIRQGDYYYNAARYLGLTEKFKDMDKTVKVKLSAEGERLMKLPYKQRQLMYIEKMFCHEIFRISYFYSMNSGLKTDKKWIAAKIRELGLCGDSLVERRASSVQGWIRWIFSVINNGK